MPISSRTRLIGPRSTIGIPSSEKATPVNGHQNVSVSFHAASNTRCRNMPIGRPSNVRRILLPRFVAIMINASRPILTVMLWNARDPPKTTSNPGSTEPTISNRLSKLGSRKTNPIVMIEVPMNQKNTPNRSDREHAAAIRALAHAVSSCGLVLHIVDFRRRKIQVATIAAMTDEARHRNARR